MAKKLKSISRREFLQGTSAVAVASLFGAEVFADGTDTEIVRAAIYPGIGIARIGNSTLNDGFFIGPEVINPPLTRAGDSRDATGALKRQAARFRIYGFNAAGRVVKEITAHDANIEWQVHLANRKGGWYRFLAALDIPEAKAMKTPRRNAAVKGADRSALVIDPGARSISGLNQSGARFQFDGGSFLGTPVSLGELRTDDEGRLLVLGGLGKSGSPQNRLVFDPNDETSFNNPDGWFDDTSDGPVRAKLVLNGKSIPVEPSWIVVGPPNYAPNVIGWRTMYDLLVHTYIASGIMPRPATTSFTRDVLPILSRLTGLQWVNKGFADTFGKGGTMNFEDPATIARLADKTNGGFRAQIGNLFRLPNSPNSNPRLWPMLYGDAFGSFANDATNNHFIVPPVPALHLQRWINGEYTADWGLKVPLDEQPEMLNRAALHFCIADAFHPGCELSWPMRHASMYSAPFRIKQRPDGVPAPDYGDYLTQDIALGNDGPLNAQGPGDLTKWMAIPWQGDTIFCRSGYEPEFDPYLPTFWPARVPNHVLSETSYHFVMNTAFPVDERIQAFQHRENWVRAMKGSPSDRILQMVSQFSEIGVIEMRPGIPNDPHFPPVMFVETLNEKAKVAAAPGAKPFTAKKDETPWEKAGWDSKEQLDEFRKIRGVKPRP